MAASDKLSKLKKALEEKKKGAKPTKEAAEAKKAEKPVPKAAEKPADKPAPKTAERTSSKPVEKPASKPVGGPNPASQKKPLGDEAPVSARAEMKTAPKPARAPLPPAKPNLNQQIVDAILSDPRVANHDQAMRLVIACVARKKEIESKTISIKDVVNDEIKKLLG